MSQTETLKRTPTPWSWAGEDYRGGWGWQLLVGPEGQGIACGESCGGPYRSLRAYVPIDPSLCKTGLDADPGCAPGIHILKQDADFLLRAVNSHDALVGYVKKYREIADYCCQGHAATCECGKCAELVEIDDVLRAAGAVK